MIHFITGDRSFSADLAIVPVMGVMLKIATNDPGATFATGDNPGVESAVSLVSLMTGVPLEIVASPYDSDGKVDWDTRHASLAARDDLVFDFIHGEASSSRIGKSLLRVAPDRTFVVV